MELVLTEKRGGGYQAHRPTCKKIGEKEQFDAEELNPEALEAVTPCSSCKPKDEDVTAVQTFRVEDVAVNPTDVGEPASEGDDEVDEWDDDDDLLGDVDEDGTEPETVESVDEDGLEPEARTAPKPVPTSAPPKGKPELKAEEAGGLLEKVAGHLGLTLPEDLKFPGFGKAVKTADKQTVYLNSKGTADVRANSPEQAAQWVEGGLAERRGGNYVRVSVRDL